MLTRNKILAILFSVFSTTALLCLTGSLMQTFLLELGVEQRLVSLHATILQATSVSSIVLFSRFADKGRLLLRTALCYMPQAVLFLCYLPLCLRAPDPAVAFGLAAVIGVVQTFFTALHTVCSYKLPYYIYRPQDFGIIATVGGIAGALISAGVGLLMTSLVKQGYDYIRLMTWAFIFASVLMACATLCTLLLRVLPAEITAAGLSARLDGDEEGSARTEKKVTLFQMFKMPIFYQLFAPNLFRGFAGGVTLVFAVVASLLSYETEILTALTTTQSISILLGCLFYGAFTRRHQARWLILVGSLLFLLFPLVAIPNTPILFLIVTSIVLFGRTLVDYAIPDSLLIAVPTEIAGPYHAWRMILNYAGQLVGTAVAAVLPLPILFVFVIGSQLVCGLGYFFARVMRPQRTPSATRSIGLHHGVKPKNASKR